MSRFLVYIAQLVGQHLARHGVEYIARIIQEGQHSDAAKQATKVFRTPKITLEEARQILNLPDSAGLEDAISRYKHLYEANEKAGATYIQGKVYRAMERIEVEHGGGPITGSQDGATNERTDESQSSKTTGDS